MDSYQFMIISAYTILIPLLIGIIKFKHIPSTFYPFVLFIFLNTTNELIASLLLYTNHNTCINYNIYYLLESVLLTYQFKKWSNLGKGKLLFNIIVSLFFAVWILESLITKVFTSLNSYFNVFYSFFLVLMSINAICHPNKDDNSKILLAPKFIICCSFILFYSNTILVDTFSAYSLKTSTAFKWKMLNILHTVNVICNMGYLFAILQFTRKTKIDTFTKNVFQG